MFKHYLWAVVGVAAALIAYADTMGLAHYLPDRLAWVAILLPVANILIQQLMRTRVDKPDADDPA